MAGDWGSCCTRSGLSSQSSRHTPCAATAHGVCLLQCGGFDLHITVFGLWHLGCVTAACLAEAGHCVIGLDCDAKVINDLQHGKPPLDEAGLDELIQAGLQGGTLEFSSDPAAALAETHLVWVAFDTPVNDQDEADIGWLRQQLDSALPFVK